MSLIKINTKKVIRDDIKYIDKTIIITGVTKGLGQSFFDFLYNNCFHLICISRNYPSYQQKISHENDNVTLILCDFTSDKMLSELEKMDDIISPEKEILFINNAGVIRPIGSFGTISNLMIKQSIDVNFTAPIILLNKIIECCINFSQNANIINISSGAIDKDIHNWELYCATKRSTFIFFETISKIYDNIKITHIDPGIMKTKMQDILKTKGFCFDDSLFMCPNHIAKYIITTYT
jgi:benzil reductase ((S)-benzoin forming)